jgi:hypothetical protein
MAAITKIEEGVVTRATTGLNLRDVAAGDVELATMAKDALVTACGPVVNGWVKVVLTGWCLRTNAGELRTDDSSGSAIKAKVHKPELLVDLVATTGDWRHVSITGYCASRFLSIVQPTALFPP